MCDVTNAVDGEVLDDLQKIFKKEESHDLVASLRRFGQHICKRHRIEQFQQEQARNGKQYRQGLIILL